MDHALADAAHRLFSDIFTPACLRTARNGESMDAAWQSCEDAGFIDALVPEAAGGAGLSLPEAWPLAHLAGEFALPVPFVETMLARAWLAACNQPIPAGPIAFSVFGTRIDGDFLQASAVPDAGRARHVLIAVEQQVLLGAVADAQADYLDIHGSSHADLRWPLKNLQRVAPPGGLAEVATLAAAASSALMAGAMHRALAMTLDYANQRSQFGKHIGKFQAIQQQLSAAAEQVWAARIASQLAFRSQSWNPAPLLAATAAAQTASAAAIVANIAHAVHGAIGITEEYDLGLITHRLRQWRTAHGTESYWARQVGEAAIAAHGQSALDFLRTRLSQAPAA